MPCFFPISGFRAANGGWTSNSRQSPTLVEMDRPCGGCIGCKLDKAADWGTRFLLESRYHHQSYFLTCTIDEAHYPLDGSVDPAHLRSFFKRLRNRRDYEARRDGVEPERLRFGAIGEYGGQTFRAHYHPILFGVTFKDLVYYGKSKSGEVLQMSDEANELWGLGNVYVGELNEKSANYVARHNIKKVNGPLAADHYRRVHPYTGEIVQLRPEFATYSTHPGIGARFYDEFRSEIFPLDRVYVGNGQLVRVPKYFSKRFKCEAVDAEQSRELVPADPVRDVRRKRVASAHTEGAVANRAPHRLETRAESARLRVDRLKRELE